MTESLLFPSSDLCRIRYDFVVSSKPFFGLDATGAVGEAGGEVGAVAVAPVAVVVAAVAAEEAEEEAEEEVLRMEAILASRATSLSSRSFDNWKDSRPFSDWVRRFSRLSDLANFVFSCRTFNPQSRIDHFTNIRLSIEENLGDLVTCLSETAILVVRS